MPMSQWLWSMNTKLVEIKYCFYRLASLFAALDTNPDPDPEGKMNAAQSKLPSCGEDRSGPKRKNECGTSQAAKLWRGRIRIQKEK
jgi:hypothetical protein